MNNFITKTLIFIPAFCSVFTFLMFFKPDSNGFIIVFLSVSCAVAISFYYSIMFSIDDKTTNHYIGCILTLGGKELKCSCGSIANMYMAENEEGNIKIIIQCTDNSCGTSVQGNNTILAEKGWNSLCGN